MPIRKLVYTPDELSKTARKFLEDGYQIDDDPDHLWCDIGSIQDGIGEERFPGVDLVEPYDENYIPEAWWKLMKFPAKMEKEMKAFFKKNPDGEVEWTW